MSDLTSEVAALKAQLAALVTASEAAGVRLEAKSIWLVFNPNKQAHWCSKTDCPNLGRKTTYDVVKQTDEEDEDGELATLIQTGVSEEAAEAEDVIQKVKRVGSPTQKQPDLGLLGAFTSKKKALDFMESYFQLNQNSLDPESENDLQLTEVRVHS